MKYCFALILSFLSLSLFALAGFEVTEYNGVRKENLEFSTVREILRHLKATGVTASGGRSRWTRSTLAAFEADYSARFRSGNRMLPLTYHPITLIARKRPEL